MRTRALIAFAAIISFFVACGPKEEPLPENVAVTGVTLNLPSLAIGTGLTGSLVATVTPSNATDKTVTWSSSNNSVATVQGGTVTGVAEGTATITATTADGGQNVHSGEAIYDVLGRRVNTIYPGHLYIVNGEKRIAK